MQGRGQSGVNLGRSKWMMPYPFPAEGFVQAGIFVTIA
jgi:hypothetical protein